MMVQGGAVTLWENKWGRDFIVGDVHGHKDLLERAMSLVDFDRRKDRLIALGDLVDRGPDSEALLQWVEHQQWFFSLCGNHEAMMLGALTDRSIRKIWDRNDNTWAKGLGANRLRALGLVIQGMPMSMELPPPNGQRWGLVHAELPRGAGWDAVDGILSPGGAEVDDYCSSPPAHLLWGRRKIHAWACLRAGVNLASLDMPTKARLWDDMQPVGGIDRVVSGHTVLSEREPVAMANLLFIDTGAFVPRGRLTIVEPQRERYWQVGRRGGRPYAISRTPKPLPIPAVAPESLRPTASTRAEAD